MNLDLTNPETNPLPEEVQTLTRLLLEGRVASLAICAEVLGEDGETEWLEGYLLDMDDLESDTRAFAGSLGLLHQRVQEELIGPKTLTIRIQNNDDDGD